MPVHVGANDARHVTVGLASSPTVDNDAEVVVWMESAKESTLLDR